MKTANFWKAVTLSALLLAGGAGAALAQGQIVSDVPYDGFLKGALIQADGPVVKDVLVLEAPSREVEVEGRAIRLERLDSERFAEIYDRLISG